MEPSVTLSTNCVCSCWALVVSCDPFDIAGVIDEIFFISGSSFEERTESCCLFFPWVFYKQAKQVRMLCVSLGTLVLACTCVILFYRLNLWPSFCDLQQESSHKNIYIKYITLDHGFVFICVILCDEELSGEG